DLSIPAFKYEKYSLEQTKLVTSLHDNLISIEATNNKVRLSDSLSFDNFILLTKSINNNIQFDISWNSNQGLKSEGNISGFAKILSAKKFDINFFNTYFKVETTSWVLNNNNQISVNDKNISFKNFDIRFN